MKNNTQTEIAISCGISQSHVANILNGRRFPAPKLASKLELATGISRLHWLYPDEFDEQGNSFANNPNIEACSQAENSSFSS